MIEYRVFVIMSIPRREKLSKKVDFHSYQLQFARKRFSQMRFFNGFEVGELGVFGKGA